MLYDQTLNDLLMDLKRKIFELGHSVVLVLFWFMVSGYLAWKMSGAQIALSVRHSIVGS